MLPKCEACQTPTECDRRGDCINVKSCREKPSTVAKNAVKLSRVRITSSNATPRSLKIVDVDTGEEMRGVLGVEISMHPNAFHLAKITQAFEVVELDVEAVSEGITVQPLKRPA